MFSGFIRRHEKDVILSVVKYYCMLIHILEVQRLHEHVFLCSFAVGKDVLISSIHICVKNRTQLNPCIDCQKD